MKLVVCDTTSYCEHKFSLSRHKITFYIQRITEINKVNPTSIHQLLSNYCFNQWLPWESFCSVLIYRLCLQKNESRQQTHSMARCFDVRQKKLITEITSRSDRVTYGWRPSIWVQTEVQMKTKYLGSDRGTDGDQVPGFRQRYGWKPSTWVQTEVQMETKHLGSDRGMDGDQAPEFRQRYRWRPSTWVQTEVRMETKHLGSDRGTEGDQAPGFRQRCGWRPSTWVQTEVRMETKHLGSDRGTDGDQAPGFRQRYGWKPSTWVQTEVRMESKHRIQICAKRECCVLTTIIRYSSESNTEIEKLNY